MIQALLPAIIPAITDIIGRFLPEDAQKRADAEREIAERLTEHLAKVDLAQIEVNKVEAASTSLFKGGWRPFIGWTCGVSLAWVYVAEPVMSFALAQLGYFTPLPTLDMSQMMPVLMGLLGLGGLRSWEKVKQVAQR